MEPKYFLFKLVIPLSVKIIGSNFMFTMLQKKIYHSIEIKIEAPMPGT